GPPRLSQRLVQSRHASGLSHAADELGIDGAAELRAFHAGELLIGNRVGSSSPCSHVADNHATGVFRCPPPKFLICRRPSTAWPGPISPRNRPSRSRWPRPLSSRC